MRMKESCLEWLILIGEKPLRTGRSKQHNHQGVGNRLIQREAEHRTNTVRL
jgi:hypothetical protein